MNVQIGIKYTNIAYKLKQTIQQNRIEIQQKYQYQSNEWKYGIGNDIFMIQF